MVIAGSPKKLPGARQGHGGKTRDLVLRDPDADEKRPIPVPPRGLLKRTRQRWVSYWESEVARAADAVADLHIVERYFRAVDEYERVRPIFEKTRLVKGSVGQLALNPLASYLASREAVMAKAEAELGLTPMSRLRLGITSGEAKLTAMELNRRLNASERSALPMLPAGTQAGADDVNDDDEDVWEAEWAPA